MPTANKVSSAKSKRLHAGSALASIGARASSTRKGATGRTGTAAPSSTSPALLSSSTSKTEQRKARLTHTNTDKECLRDDAGFLRRAIYTIDTHNGFKFFTVIERTVCHVIAWLCFATVATYSVIFLQGFVDGFQTTEFESIGVGDAAVNFAASTAATASSGYDDATTFALPTTALDESAAAAAITIRTSTQQHIPTPPIEPLNSTLTQSYPDKQAKVVNVAAATKFPFARMRRTARKDHVNIANLGSDVDSNTSNCSRTAACCGNST